MLFVAVQNVSSEGLQQAHEVQPLCSCSIRSVSVLINYMLPSGGRDAMLMRRSSE